MADYLHIVCLDAPAPPNYGGAMEMYYKIKALAASGKKIILHYFDYRADRNADELQAICVAIHRYHRKSFFQSLSFNQPYIIASRVNKQVIKKLNEDDHPILLEGLHCAGAIPQIKNTSRIVLRMHNNEAEYYRHLATVEKKIFKKVFFAREARLLDKYQHSMPQNISLAVLSKQDCRVFETEYGFKRTTFIPCFVPWQKISASEGKSNFCLYHGNMQVAENEAAALWLIANVFSKINNKCVIAGNGISKKIEAAVQSIATISLVNNPGQQILENLISTAQINILPSLNNTGVKLKLLHALFNGRFCITNTNGIKGSAIDAGVSIANSPDEYLQLITQLLPQEFTSRDIEERKYLERLYDNEANAQKLNALW